MPTLPPSSPPATKEGLPSAPLAVGAGERLERPGPLAHVRAWKPWLALAAAGVCAVLVCTLQPQRVAPEHVSRSTQQVTDSQLPDAGSAAVGDTSPAGPGASAPPSSKPKPITEDAPAMPRPGQSRRQLQPDAKGRCPGSMQVAFNGNCWVENPLMNAKACVESGYVLFKGKCYSPVLESPQKPVPTSSPAKAR